MVALRFDSTVPFSRETVYDWNARPGAVRRLTPPFLAEVLEEPAGGITPGARTRLGIRAAPGARLTTEFARVHPGREYTDRLVRGPLRRWEHRRVFEDLGQTTRVRDEVDFALPARSPGLAERAVRTAIARVSTYRQAQLLGDLQFGASHPGPPLRIAISGSTGLIGTQLVAMLSALGHTVVPIVRERHATPGAIAMDSERGWVNLAALEGVDVVIHLAGEPISGRFTSAHKRRIAASRIGPTRLLAEAAAAAGVGAFISASAIGYYGANPAGEVGEESPPGSDFLSHVCVEWERATQPAREAGLRVAHLRTGLVLSPLGGSLAVQLPLFRSGVGGPLAGGDAWQSWISLDDVVGLYAHAALDPGVRGPLNAVAPQPVTSGEFASELGHVLSRPAVLPVPAVGPIALLGREGARLLAGASQKVSAVGACASGYEFRHLTLGSALRHLLGRVAER